MSRVQTVVVCAVVTVSFLKKRMENGTSFAAPHYEYKRCFDFPQTALTEEDCSVTTSASISCCITQRNPFRNALSFD